MNTLFSLVVSGWLVALTALSAAWGTFNLRRNRGVGVGALTTSAALGAAWLASFTNLWREGGWAMVVVAMGGAYALGSAAAARVTKRWAPRVAAWAALVVTVLLGAVVRHAALADLKAVTRTLPPADAGFILAVGSSEAWRPVQLSVLVGVCVAGLLLRRGGSGPTLGSGERVDEMKAEQRRTRVERYAVPT